jgi:hypothetical protein
MIGVLPNTIIKAAEQIPREEDFVIKDGVLMKYVGEGGDVVVPEGIETIGMHAFEWKVSIRNSILSVTLPDSVTSIGDSAFFGCKNLKVLRCLTLLFRLEEMLFLAVII